MRGGIIAFVMMLLAQPVVSKAQNDLVETVVSQPARELANLYMPTAMVKDMGEREFRKNFVASFDKAPGGAMLEKQYPGLKAAGMQAGLAALLTAYDVELPKIQASLASYLDKEFTAKELSDLTDFYNSPAGQKLMQSMMDGADTSALAVRAAKDPTTFKLEANDVDGIINLGALSKLTQAELAVVMRFGATPAGRKFQQHSRALLNISTEGTNVLLQKIMPVAQSKIIDAVSAHIASFGNGKNNAP